MELLSRTLDGLKRRLLAPLDLASEGWIVPQDIFGPRELALYVHLPFCASLCSYCVFNRYRAPEQMAAYVAALQREIAYYGGVPQLQRLGVHSIFLGGGTPSFLPAELIERVLTALADAFALRPDVQITLEANPESIERRKLQRYRRLGVNRVSVGVQSFDERLLRGLGRRHRAAEIHAALRLLREEGFDEVSLDLMFGLPGQTRAGFAAELAQAIAAPVTHISTFALLPQPGTPIWRQRERLRPLWPMYRDAAQALQRAGFSQYTPEDFTRSGVRSGYQEEAWRPAAKGFLGLGAGALSMYGSSGWHNIGDLDDYIAAARPEQPPIAHGCNNDTRQRMFEHVVVALRGLRLDPAAFEARFGVPLQAFAGRWLWALRAAGLLAPDDDGALRVSQRGSFLASLLWGQLVLRQLAQARATRRAGHAHAHAVGAGEALVEQPCAVAAQRGDDSTTAALRR